MYAKLETKSNRVKGLSFHPTRPWILASLHNGVIQLWDYRIRTLVDRFDEHEGPVRGVSFHPTQPLFVSGGDDYKIKVWNYKQRRCLFTLLGHLDYIRTTEFHREYPWILSASYDQTIRIWNWQSRNYIAVLTGHNHYVMCASFHPKEDLVVSASLDQSVRVWDISGLRKKNISPGTMGHGHHEEGLRLPQNELFGNTDAVVKYVLEGHDRGVNWASFHPTNNSIVSGADDRHIKIWKMSETKAWELDTLRGHFNNVSCVIFHPRQDLILSNSEDKTIRVWEPVKKSAIHTFRREHDRFWILAAHPEQNLFAAGHDSGLIVFKLERERPPYVSFGNEAVFYLKEKYIRTCEFSSARDVPLLSLRSKGLKYKSLSYSPEDKALLLNGMDGETGAYELYLLSKDSRSSDSSEPKKGLGTSAVFIGRKRFAVLDKSHQIVVKNLKNEESKRITASGPVEAIFPGPTGTLLLRSEDKMVLFDLQQKKNLAELSTPEIKFVYWSNDKNPLVALLSKDSIIIANKKLEQLSVVHETTVKVKSGAWDDNGVFIYSTHTHIKYCLPTGDYGIIRTIDAPLYITGVKGNRVYCLDRECKNRVLAIDSTEYIFKQALLERKYSVVLKMIAEYNLVGTSIIAYLQQKGFPEVALHFVKDDKTKLNLALEGGNIEVALEAAKVLDDKDSWLRLGNEALRQGNHQIVEMAYQRTKNFERLSFLYLITGNVEKLKKMLKIADMRGDVMGRFHNSLYLGDIQERIRLLEEVGQVSLAYICARIHGFEEIAQTLEQKLNGKLPEIPSNPSLLLPPSPILRLHEVNWPLLTVHKSYFDDLGKEDKNSKFAAVGVEEEENPGGWDAGPLDEEEAAERRGKEEEGELEGELSLEPSPGGGWEDALDLGEDLKDIEVAPTTSKGEKSFVVLPHPGPSVSQIWTNNSTSHIDHAAAGSFESAMRIMQRELGIIEFEPLKPFLFGLYFGSRGALPTLPSLPSLSVPLSRSGEGLRSSLPSLAAPDLQNLIDFPLKGGYKAFTAGNFSEAVSYFLKILHSIPFLSLESKKEINEAKELVGICREYLVGLKVELHRRGVADPGKQTELAAYFTHINLQVPHLILALRSAMSSAYKIKNYLHAASFARRLLDLSPKEDLATQAKKVIKFAESNATNAVPLNYDEKNPFVVCVHSFAPIYKGTPSVSCPFCGTQYLPEHKGKLCGICNVAQIGREVTKK